MRHQWRSGWNPGHAPWHDDPRFAEMIAARREGSARARLWLPVIVSLLLQVPPTLFWRREVPLFGEWGWLVVLGLAIVGPLLLIGARRFPGPVVALVSLAAVIDFVASPADFGPPYFAVAFAIVGAIVRGARVWAWISVGVCWIAGIAAGIALGIDWHPARIAATTFGILIVIGIGESMRTRREWSEQYRARFAQRKQSELQAERVRIARELHDVLAHSLSQINVQAGVGLHLLEKQPEKAAEALASIKESSKAALIEVRSVLGVLRADDGSMDDAPLVPEPDLARIPALAESLRAQGLTVTLRTDITDAPDAIQLALFRIVQESLTNIVRHAGATKATIALAATDTDYTVEVKDNGRGAAERVGESTEGRGLLGMRERAELLGGTLTTGRASGGGFVVAARIPRRDES